MKLEDLILLKSELENGKELYFGKYNVFQGPLFDNVLNDPIFCFTQKKNYKEITTLEDTKQFVKNFENNSEKLIEYLISRNYEFKKIDFQFNVGIIIEDKFLSKIVNEEDCKNVLLSGMYFPNVLDIVPISFKFKLYDYDENEFDFDHFEKLYFNQTFNFFGYVNYNKFLKSMEELGYELSINNDVDFRNLNEFFKHSFTSNKVENNCLTFSVDFGNKKIIKNS